MKKLIIVLLFSLAGKISNATCYFDWRYYDYSTGIWYTQIPLSPNLTQITINYGDSLKLSANTNDMSCGGLSNISWYHNGNLLTGWTTGWLSTEIIVHDAGTYTNNVYVGYYGGTLTHYFEVVVLGGPTTVYENSLQNILTLHPNPVNDKLEINISVLKQSDLQYDIFDMTGKNLRTFSQNNFIGEFKQSENFESLASGIYFFQLTLDGERIVKKIVKQ